MINELAQMSFNTAIKKERRIIMSYNCYAFLHNAVNKMFKRMGILISAGYANGYVAVPPEHPLFGRHYDYPDICIHGGLTFSGPSEEVFENFDMNAIEMLDGKIPKGYWVFGFDTCHAGDNPDTCSREWCIEETNRLKNILEITNEDFVTYELAVKLKEKGFKEPCHGYYHCNGGNDSFELCGNGDCDFLNSKNKHRIAAPTIPQVLK